MTRRLLAVSALALASVVTGAPGALAQTEERTVIDGVEFPTGIAFLSDGTMLFNERKGVIHRADADGGSVETLAEVPTVIQGETGLLGITPSPDENSIYVFATELDGESNTVWRVASTGGEPERVVTGMAASFYHNGGGVAFDEDGMLLVSNGEEHDSGIAQDPDALGGKVYRFTPDGDVPSDNPFGDSPALAIGLRNPYGLTVDPETGMPWVTENGPSEYDEVNRIVAGGNYGWPGISGPSDENSENSQQPEDLESGEYQEPAASYEDIIVPTGIAFAGEGASAEVSGALFFASYGEEAIHKLTLNETRDAVIEDEIFHRPGEPVIALAWGPEGLYFSTPESIRVLAVVGAGETDGDPSPGAGGAADPEPSPTVLTDPEADGSGIGRLLAIAVPILLIVGFLATRSRLDRASRDTQPPNDP